MSYNASNKLDSEYCCAVCGEWDILMNLVEIVYFQFMHQFVVHIIRILYIIYIKYYT